MPLTHDQIASAVRYYRSDETRDLTSVAAAIGVPRSELADACRANAHLADALDFREDTEAANAAADASTAAEQKAEADVQPSRQPDVPA